MVPVSISSNFPLSIPFTQSTGSPLSSTYASAHCILSAATGPLGGDPSPQCCCNESAPWSQYLGYEQVTWGLIDRAIITVKVVGGHYGQLHALWDDTLCRLEQASGILVPAKSGSGLRLVEHSHLPSPRTPSFGQSVSRNAGH